jgi:hypothetical protein
MTIDDRQPFDLERIARVMERFFVRYVLIGGASGVLHGMTDYVMHPERPQANDPFEFNIEDGAD